MEIIVKLDLNGESLCTLSTQTRLHCPTIVAVHRHPNMVPDQRQALARSLKGAY